MASYVEIQLDTTAPSGHSVSIAGGALYTTGRDVVLTLTSPDADTAQVKIYGDVDDSFAPTEYRATEANAPWVTFAGTKNVRLSSGDGSKTVKIKVRDDVWNVSSEATDSITLDSTLPVVTVQSGPTPDKISKVSGKDVSTIVWQSDSQYDAYKVKLVPATTSLHSEGTEIPATGGSTNVSGSTANQPADTNVTTEIDGDDLETAAGGGGNDGDKIVKVFVQDDAGNWSV